GAIITMRVSQVNRSRNINIIAVGLLGLMCVLMVSSARLKSPTMDEQNHIARGYAYLRTGDLRLNLDHPPLVNSLSAAPLLLLPNLELPTDNPTWEHAHVIAFATQFLWHANHNPDQILLLARLPIILLAILLGCFVFRWATELHGPLAGLLALFLYVFDPNILAHARLATTDLGVTCFLFIAVYCFWRWLDRPTRSRLAAAGLTLGLALASKYSALVLIPILPLIGLTHVLVSRRGEGQSNTSFVQRAWKLAVAVGLASVLAGVVVWAVYGFELRPLVEGALSVPAPTYVRGLQGLFRHSEIGHPAFLCGHYFSTGRWDYFPIAFAIKTPLPTLILLGISLVLTVKRRAWRSAYPLLLPVLVYLTTSFSGQALNIGYRHILPLLPFLLVFASGVAHSHVGSERSPGECPRAVRGRLPRTLCYLLLVLWSLVASVRIYPDYLAYFNELVGGPDEGWRYLVDSNLDWGQDLKGLQRYAERTGIEEMYLSWFGSTYPDAYGYDIPHRLLPSYIYYPGQVTGVPFNPLRPAPGVYAISATNLQGVYFSDPDLFAWFRERQPVAKIGYSIFIYEVGSQGEAAAESVVCLSGVRLNELDSEARTLTVDKGAVRLKWFDHQTSFLLPTEGQRASYVVPEVFHFSPDLRQRFHRDSEPLYVSQDESYTVYHLASRSALTEKLASVQRDSAIYWSPAVEFVPETIQESLHPLTPPVNFNHQVAFLGYEYVSETLPIAPQGTLELLTYWQVLKPATPPLSIFVHLLDAHSAVVGAYDGLSVSPASWEPGDIFIQLHSLSIAPDVPSGEYQVELGFYSPDTMQRLLILQAGEAVADRLLLSPVRVQGR
ncbi:MAG: glycosyltransferase family 39 protein, partial [Chloroflexota bacterium]|nr:glycosyltransferase family 39 protein [Chloroflexota bacterium]